MFSFHKPKIYRSVKGCCICAGKSSSSRFTDSKKYESEFETCFATIEKRSGDICNACVLLVKRWKKMPNKNGKNWHHIIDARAGPGTKSFMKYTSKSKINKRSNKKIRSKNRPLKSSGGLSDDVSVGEECLSDQSSFGGISGSTSLAPSPISSEGSDDSSAIPPVPQRTYKGRRQKASNPVKLSSFLDMSFWKKEKICCGTIFKGTNGVVLIDPRYLKPCTLCKKPSRNAEVSGNSNLRRLNNTVEAEEDSATVGQQLPALRNQEMQLDH